jgi:hypothetical protein
LTPLKLSLLSDAQVLFALPAYGGKYLIFLGAGLYGQTHNHELVPNYHGMHITEHGIFYGIKSYRLRQGNDFIGISCLVNI